MDLGWTIYQFLRVKKVTKQNLQYTYTYITNILLITLLLQFCDRKDNMVKAIKLIVTFSNNSNN